MNLKKELEKEQKKIDKLIARRECICVGCPACGLSNIKKNQEGRCLAPITRKDVGCCDPCQDLLHERMRNFRQSIVTRGVRRLSDGNG